MKRLTPPPTSRFHSSCRFPHGICDCKRRRHCQATMCGSLPRILCLGSFSASFMQDVLTCFSACPHLPPQTACLVIRCAL